jgi:hypothetical protein
MMFDLIIGATLIFAGFIGGFVVGDAHGQKSRQPRDARGGFIK